MKKKLEYHVQVKFFKYSNYILVIRDNDFILKKEKSKSKDIYTYSLVNAVVLDRTEKNVPKISVSSGTYSMYIKPINLEEKKSLLSVLEDKIKELSKQTAFSQDYFSYLKEIAKKEDTNPLDSLYFKLNTFQVLMGEIKIKLNKYKDKVKEKLNSSLTNEFMGIYNDINTIYSEMKKQFDKIISGVSKYVSLFQDKVGDVEKVGDSSDEEEDKKKNNPFSLEKSDYYNPDFDFPPREKLDKKIKCPENIIKEMITTFTKKQSAPVYFNEPISMTQKQCEKFYYLDLLTKASKVENNKPLQMCYISAFIVGEIFMNIGRFLKPFSPILGETFEYFDNSKKFRYYSENVKHHPQITAFIGETPDFAYYGDTSNDTSFKILKGSLDLTFKNKINIIFKNSNNHYVYNRPVVSVKGLLKPPMYSDYLGTTIIQDVNDKNVKCELVFVEQTWTQSVLGGFQGKAYSGEDKVEYLIGGNWKDEIYITDKDGNNKEVLLTQSKDNAHIKNTLETYYPHPFTCNLNYLPKKLEDSLPKNDSRFRQDMRLLEIGEDLTTAQIYKQTYEEKQRKEIKDENHKILFFEEKMDVEIGEGYYVPNGKYWEMKKEEILKKNENWDIFVVGDYYKKEEEKVRGKDNPKDEKKTEEKKVEDKKSEDKKPEDKTIEEKNVEDKKVEDKK